MRKYSKAKWLPISRNFTNRKRTRTRGIVLHTDAGNNASLRGWFNNPSARASSHFHVAKNGTVEQYVDADLIAWTTGEGNPTTVGVETQGYGTEEWTDAQVEELAALCRWAARTYGFPLRRMKSSKPGARGVGTHRLGVNGNFPNTGIQRGREQRGGGELWSSARGKTCPGDKRQAQFPGIVRLAQRHKIVKSTAGRKGRVALYKTPKTGRKNITRTRKVGKNVRIVEFQGRWGKTLKGDWIKLSKVK